jgi:hypothetical protein
MGNLSSPAIVLLLLLSATAQAQTDNPDWRMPRTEYGFPDLQGTWFFGSRTPFQRPVQLGSKKSYTEQEARELEQVMRGRLEQWDQALDPDRDAPERGAVIRQEADDIFLGHYLEPVLVPVQGEYRTSVIYQPDNGRLPLRDGFRDFHAQRRTTGLLDTDGPEGQPLSGRCLMFGPALPSLTPVMMNPNMMIVQNRDYVVITTEMIHDARIIRIDSDHRDDGIARWMGDSIAHWEGDTLVVHSQGFRPEQSHPMFLRHSEALEITERYTLVADDQLHYEFIARDDIAFTEEVRAERIITRNAPQEQVYEYACHEGNHSLVGILRGVRRQQVDAEFDPSVKIEAPREHNPEDMLRHSQLAAPPQ